MHPMPLRSLWLTLTLLGLATLPACQGVWSVPTSLTIASTGQAMDGQALQVTVHFPGRKIASLATDVTQLVIGVHTAVGDDYARHLDLTTPIATTTFTQLPAGPTTVTLTALNATQEVLGSTTQAIILQGGTTQMDIPFYLSQATAPPAPTPTPTTLTVGATIVDGPALTQPRPTPPVPSIGKVMWERLLGPSMDFDAHLAPDSQGNVWVVVQNTLERYAQDGTVTRHVPELLSSGPLVVDAQDNVWLAGSGRLYKVSPQGVKLGAYAFPSQPNPYTQGSSRAMAMDAAGQIWIAEGQKLWRISPAGAILDTLTLPANGGQVQVDRTTGTAWVTLPTQGKLARYSAQGQPLGTVTVNQNGATLTGLAIDVQGNAWVGQSSTRRLLKVAPDGTHVAEFNSFNDATHLLFDATGRILALNAPDMLNFYNFVGALLAPDGTMLGKEPIGWTYAATIDAAGYVWAIGIPGTYGSDMNIVKVAL